MISSNTIAAKAALMVNTCEMLTWETSMPITKDPMGVTAAADELNTADARAIYLWLTHFISWIWRIPPISEAAAIMTK